MTLYNFIISFILTGLTFAFAAGKSRDPNLCAIPLSHFQDKRLGSLAVEDQNMIIISSLIAKQLQINNNPVQISPTIMLLSTLTDVKVYDRDHGNYDTLTANDHTLFAVFKHLGLLTDIRTILLDQLSLNHNSLISFPIRDNGGFTLYLDALPNVISFDYDDTINMLLDNFMKSRKTVQNPLTFSGYLLLASPSLNHAIRSVLFHAFNTRNVREIRSILYKLFNDIKQQRAWARFTPEEKDIVQRAVQLFQEEENMTVAKVANILDVDLNSRGLNNLLDKYEQEYGLIPGRQRQKQSQTLYTPEQRKAFVQRAIKLFQEEENMNVLRAADILGLNENTLQKWLLEHEQQNGPIPGRQLQNYYTPEEQRSHCSKS